MSTPNGETSKERFDAQKTAAGIMEPADWSVYIYIYLELKPDDEGVPKYYVGHTNRLQQRIHDHMTGDSCAWVRRFGVLTVLDTLRTTEEGALGLEVAKCTEYKVRYGWDNVKVCVDNNPGSSMAALPRYWQAPAEGLTPRGPRSRSPAADRE